MSKNEIVHLHCLWRKGPQALAGVTKAMAFCGAKNLLREQVTSHLDDATCPRCTAKAKEPPPTADQPNNVVNLGKGTAAKATSGPSKPANGASKPARGRGRQPHNPWPYAAGAKLKLLTPRNPTKPGTAKHKRWSIVFVHNGKTWEQYRDAGGHPETLRNAVKDKIVEIVE